MRPEFIHNFAKLFDDVIDVIYFVNKIVRKFDQSKIKKIRAMKFTYFVISFMIE